MKTATTTGQGQSRHIRIGAQQRDGVLRLPADARGCVIFVHGTGSSYLSPRNRYVAQALNARGFATLSLKLLSQDEARDWCNLYDIAFLGRRVLEAINQLRREPDTASMPLAMFGSGTGAAAALVAAAERPEAVVGVVSCGGRPDLAADALRGIRIPTLQIVGGADRETLVFNQRAMQVLAGEMQVHVVPGASRLFQERGAFDQVVAAAADWLESRLGSSGSSPPPNEGRIHRTDRR